MYKNDILLKKSLGLFRQSDYILVISQKCLYLDWEQHDRGSSVVQAELDHLGHIVQNYFTNSFLIFGLNASKLMYSLNNYFTIIMIKKSSIMIAIPKLLLGWRYLYQARITYLHVVISRKNERVPKNIFLNSATELEQPIVNLHISAFCVNIVCFEK